MDTILPAPDHLDLVKLTTTKQSVTAIVQSHHVTSNCPLCHRSSSRIHSRYVRHLHDLPWHGIAMRLELQVSRFFCDDPACRRQIFTRLIMDPGIWVSAVCGEQRSVLHREFSDEIVSRYRE